MKCNFIGREENIQKYLNGDMPEAEMAVFEEHFLECHDCIEELRDSLQFAEFIQNEGNHLFPELQGSEKLKEKIISNEKISSLLKFFRYMNSPKRISYGVVTLILLLFLYMLYESNSDLITNERIGSNELEINQSSDSIDQNILSNENMPAETIEELYAANFIKSDNLEFIIEQRYRGGKDINVISPQSGITVSEKILFNWVTEEKQQLFLIILNNREDILFRFTAAENNLLFNISENKLDPGLYYWKLASDKELRYIGKFLIRE